MAMQELVNHHMSGSLCSLYLISYWITGFVLEAKFSYFAGLIAHMKQKTKPWLYPSGLGVEKLVVCLIYQNSMGFGIWHSLHYMLHLLEFTLSMIWTLILSTDENVICEHRQWPRLEVWLCCSQKWEAPVKTSSLQELTKWGFENLWSQETLWWWEWHLLSCKSGLA